MFLRNLLHLVRHPQYRVTLEVRPCRNTPCLKYNLKQWLICECTTEFFFTPHEEPALFAFTVRVTADKGYVKDTTGSITIT